MIFFGLGALAAATILSLAFFVSFLAYGKDTLALLMWASAFIICMGSTFYVALSIAASH